MSKKAWTREQRHNDSVARDKCLGVALAASALSPMMEVVFMVHGVRREIVLVVDP